MKTGSISLNDYDELERRIGYTFKCHGQLKQALTHPSAIRKQGDVSHYQRLEFLGDRVLGLNVAQLLFDEFPNAKEGELSVRLNALVNGATCAEIADELGLVDFVRTGTDIKKLTGKRMMSVRADVTESLIAAIYLDGGANAAADFVKRFWSSRLAASEAGRQDSKTALQEWAHAQKAGTPQYTIINRAGPDHDPVFKVEVSITGLATATGTGRSKRAAEQLAAREILVREGVWASCDADAEGELN